MCLPMLLKLMFQCTEKIYYKFWWDDELSLLKEAYEDTNKLCRQTASRSSLQRPSIEQEDVPYTTSSETSNGNSVVY